MWGGKNEVKSIYLRDKEIELVLKVVCYGKERCTKWNRGSE